MIRVHIINKSKNELPAYETLHAAGMDLRANLDEEITIKPFKRAIIPTGIYIELPVEYEAQIRPRSGLAAKYGITVLNAPGTIDSDYQGEIKIILINLGDDDFIVKNGERIAQMIINKHEKAALITIDEFSSKTERGTGGFGHTGI